MVCRTEIIEKQGSYRVGLHYWQEKHPRRAIERRIGTIFQVVDRKVLGFRDQGAA
jgi:hypothetical protein